MGTSSEFSIEYLGQTVVRFSVRRDYMSEEDQGKNKIILQDGSEFEGDKIIAAYKDSESFPTTGLISDETWEIEEIFKIKMMIDHFFFFLLEDRIDEEQQEMYNKIQFLMRNKKEEILDKLTPAEEELFRKLYATYEWEVIYEGQLGEEEKEDLRNEFLAEEENNGEEIGKIDTKDNVIKVDFAEKD